MSLDDLLNKLLFMAVCDDGELPATFLHHMT